MEPGNEGRDYGAWEYNQGIMEPGNGVIESGIQTMELGPVYYTCMIKHPPCFPGDGG